MAARRRLKDIEGQRARVAKDVVASALVVRCERTIPSSCDTIKSAKCCCLPATCFFRACPRGKAMLDLLGQRCEEDPHLLVSGLIREVRVQQGGGT